jgi:hypothetical protein
MREDLKNANLLFCGTEFAAFASLDRGKTWTRINGNLPTVAVHELALQPTAATWSRRRTAAACGSPTSRRCGR